MKHVPFFAALALCGVMLVGCASNKGGNPVADWQNDRFMAKEIKAVNDGQKALALADVTYKSTMGSDVLAAPINALAPISAALYLQVVKGVDGMAAAQDGRLIYLGVQNDIAAGAKFADLRAQMTAEEKAAYDAYAKSIAKADQDHIISTVVMPLIQQVGVESAKVALVVASIKDSDAFKALAGFEALKEGKNLLADGDALSKQFADTTAGANLWLDLLKKDKEAKAFMKDYPVE